MRGILFCIFTLIAVLPIITEAQFNADFSSITGEALTIELNPPFPAPGETATASIDDYASGIIGGNIAWFMNGARATGTENLRSVTFVAGELGRTDTLSVSLAAGNGLTLQASKTITPRYLDLIIEPQTYIPQFYRGRALPVHDSIIRATALLHDRTGIVNPTNYTYLWRVNNTTLNNGGIRGGFQNTYAVPHGANHTVTLEVYDATGELITRRAMNVQSSKVDPRLYEESALYGLSYTTVKSPLQFIGNSVTLRAVPYNLDVRSVGQNLFTEWQINGQRTAQSTDDPFLITLERRGTGASTVAFKLRNRVSLLQGGEVSTLLQF